MEKGLKKAFGVLAGLAAASVAAAGLIKVLPKLVDSANNARLLAEKEAELTELFGPRCKCMDCIHCKKRLYAPFYHKDVNHAVPLFCRRFRMNLDSDPQLRCQAAEPEDAIREKQPLKLALRKNKH